MRYHAKTVNQFTQDGLFDEQKHEWKNITEKIPTPAILQHKNKDDHQNDYIL